MGLLAGGCRTAPSGSSPAATAPPSGLTPAQRRYLGLAEGTPFAFERVRGEILIVELFDMYCRVCQQSAPKLKELYRLIHDRGLDRRIKMVAIGAGNTSLEAEMYRRKFQPAFPVLPDRDKKLTRQLGSPHTPALVALRLGSGKVEPFYTHVGYLRDPDKVLEEILAKAGR